MKKIYKEHEWKIIEDRFDQENHQMSESIFSLGNGKMGQRANFEEFYSGSHLPGNYIAGIYYPDKTKVGWWKVGYPEYFAKVLNAPSWIGVHPKINGVRIDLAQCKINSYERVLDMKKGLLKRSASVELRNRNKISFETERFVSIFDDEAGFVKYSITLDSDDADIQIYSFVDGNVKNEDSNYDEKFWDISETIATEECCLAYAKTKKTRFGLSTAATYDIEVNGKKLKQYTIDVNDNKDVCSHTIICNLKKGDTLTFYKYASVHSSLNYSEHEIVNSTISHLSSIKEVGYEKHRQYHIDKWEKKWKRSDIVIEGDVAAQQGIRFNIFQLNQTYTGEDDRLNIGPKGFTGEKYGGTTYWDTEAYCFPFFLSTAPAKVARQLLFYRYKQLGKAIENGQKLGFNNGAALYPMVTINGEECHNEWEITFEEIHRNGAIAYAIFDYVRYTADWEYVAKYGFEVLVGISRFWKQRSTFSNAKRKYVILGVTGPNEYENNVNNNWYTNYIASWVLKFTLEVKDFLYAQYPEELMKSIRKLKLKEKEFSDWDEIRSNMYLPRDESIKVFLQQDGYLDKELLTVDDIPSDQKPINQYWSWDRILRSCFIKQADVIQGMYFFEDHFSKNEIKRNFDFYEPKTVHESSLSPCIYSVVASKIGYIDRAYELYLRTSRLDLDDYNNEAHEGCHITSMAGTWLTVVKGFAGMRVKKNLLYFKPQLPKQWESMKFVTNFRGAAFSIEIKKDSVTLENITDKPVEIAIKESEFVLKGKEIKTVML